LPEYADLPVIPGAPPGSSWGLWGPDDRFGALNLLTPETALRASAQVRSGEVFSLNLSLELPSPPLGGREAHKHRVMVLPEGYSNDDEFDSLNVQVSSQLDGFGHVQHPRHGYYNGLPLASHSMHAWAERGLVARGVLVDMQRWRQAQGRPLAHGHRDYITADELVAALDDQQVSIEPGDLLMVYTGFLSWYRTLDPAARQAIALDPPMPGLAPGRATLAALWDLHLCVVASDNMAVEAWPTERPLTDANEDPDHAGDIFLHCELIPLLGIPIGELWDLERLADACAKDRRYTCMVTCAPMNQPGGVASMANAIAIR
jgi:hypothetical protein